RRGIAYIKPAGTTGHPGFPGGEMAVSLEPIGRPIVTAKQIIEHLSKALKVAYSSMATHRPRMAAGWYEIKPRGIRQINVRDLDTASHEAGHHIDHFYKIRRQGISKAGTRTWKMPEGTAKGTAAELLKLGKMLYGTRKPPGGYKSEGIAEFVRGYLTGHLDIKKEAPNFYKWFMKDYLPNNPDVAAALNNARAMLTDYRLQGAEARIESQINRKDIAGGLRDRAKAANLWFQQMFVDEFVPLKKALEEVGLRKKGVEAIEQPLKPSEDPYELAVYFTQKEGARARHMVLNGTIDFWGNKTGKGLKEIMKPIADENAVRPFTHWIVAARSLDLMKRGIKPGITKADAQYVYDLYKDNPGWKETAKEITDWNGRVLDYLVQGGSLEPTLAKKMRELNPVYVPFLRAFAKGEKEFGGGGAGRGLITTKKGVFSIEGSGREIIDPFESMITQTRRMISIAHKSAIARALANLEKHHRGLAGFIWRVPPPKKATTFKAEQVKRELMRHGVEFPEGGLKEMDFLLTVYGNSPIYLGKERLIAIVENGKKNWYEVSPEMYRLLQGLDKFYLPRFLDVTLGKPGRAVRLGATGINASFGLVKNPIRDSMDTIFKGTHARGPLASAQGVAKDLSRLGLAKSLGIKPSKAAEEFVSMGGQISGFVGQDRRSLQHLRGDMLASSVGRYTIQTIKHPIDALRQVFGVAESGPRIQEYEKALEFAEKKYGEGSPDAKVYAFNKAQDQTINYSRHGVIGKWVNQMVPFWNANAQDISKVHRTFRTRGKEATAYAIAFLTLPALGLWWLNKDEEWYKELPAYEKANYLHVKVPEKDVILRLPVPFLVGHIFQGFPTATVDALYRADPKKVTDFFDQVLEGDVYPLTEWPSMVGPIIDVLQNEDWAGRPIVPKGVEGKMPSDQYKDYTTEFAKSIGKIFNYSPAKIEHLLNSWSGGLYRRVSGTAELVAGQREKELQPADWPVIGKIIVRDPYAPKDSIERFYEEKDRLNRMYQSDKIVPESNLDRRRKRYNYISTKYLSLYWKKLQKAKKVSERKMIYQKIGALIRKAEKTS
ncbi:MAG: LPD38 domain-containing protein, partial [Planctomycetota bacterium]